MGSSDLGKGNRTSPCLSRQLEKLVVLELLAKELQGLSKTSLDLFPTPAMAGTEQQFHPAGNAGSGHGVGHFVCLGVRNERIFGSLKNQQRSIVLRNIRDRRRLL